MTKSLSWLASFLLYSLHTFAQDTTQHRVLGRVNSPDQLAKPYVILISADGFRSDFADKYDRQVTVEDILDDGKLDKVKDWSINDHVAMVDKIMASGKCNTDLSDKQLKNLTAYAVTMPSEAVMKLWKAVGAAHVQNAVKFHKIAGNHIVKIMTGGKE
jgi:hypothetical protein